MAFEEGSNHAGRLWLLGNAASLRAIGHVGYASHGRGCVLVRLAPNGRPLDEPRYLSAAAIPMDDRIAAEAATGAASYDPERLKIVLVEQERGPTRDFLLPDVDGTALEGMEAVPPGVARSSDGPLLSARERAVRADAAVLLADECLADLARIMEAPRPHGSGSTGSTRRRKPCILAWPRCGRVSGSSRSTRYRASSRPPRLLRT